MTKICGKCKQDLPIENFAKSTKKGFQSYCKKCNKEHKNQWIVNNRDKVAVNRLWSRYRLKQIDFDKMIIDQNNTCLLCPQTFEDKVPAIDHDHNCCPGEKSCGKCVRGLLCNNCNIKLGWYEKRKEAIAKYLNNMPQ